MLSSDAEMKMMMELEFSGSRIENSANGGNDNDLTHTGQHDAADAAEKQ